MLTVLILAIAYVGVRALVSAAQSLRQLPRSNDDMIFY
jgi:hypothetical protein